MRAVAFAHCRYGPNSLYVRMYVNVNGERAQHYPRVCVSFAKNNVAVLPPPRAQI